jgi:4-amino-4-deoxy-L-arabinose transferase-like glycosyltransferase
MPTKSRFGALLVLLAAQVALVFLVWIRGEQLLPTLLLQAATLAAAAWLLRGPGAAVPAPEPALPEAPASGFGSLLGAALLVWLAVRAGDQARAETWQSLGLTLAAMVLVLRVGKEGRLPAFGARAGGWVLLGLFGLAAAFRLYRIGELPVGVCGVDEAGLWIHARQYMNGLRATYSVFDLNQGADGMVPYYMQALGLKAFGDSMRGWRLEAAVTGILTTGLVWRAGKDLGGRWVAAAAAFLWAVSVWPVTISRAHYFMVETSFVALLCMVLLFAALRRGGGWRWVAAGYLWALCFNVYPAARIMLGVVPWLLAMAWLFARPRRRELGDGLPPLVFGFAVGIAPLLLWLGTCPWGMKAYFVAFDVGHQGGNLGGGGLFDRIDMALGRVVTEFPRNFGLLTKYGAVNPHLVPTQYPVLHPALLSLALLGAAAAVARFRDPLHAIVLYWWATGMVPAMASAPSTVPHDRRMIMVLIPSILLGALGATALLRKLNEVAQRARILGPLLLLAVLAGAGWYANASWNDYFLRNQRDKVLLENGRATFTTFLKALGDERHKGPAIAISTWRMGSDDWNGALQDPYNDWLWGAMVPDTETYFLQRGAPHFAQGGLSLALSWAQQRVDADKAAQVQPRDLLILLTPFYYYLEPEFLRLGATLVRTATPPLTERGPLLTVGMAFNPTETGRIYRLPASKFPLDLSKLSGPFTVKLSELKPPAGLDRAAVGQTKQGTPPYLEQMRNYESAPARWKDLRSTTYRLSDPWFWTTEGNLPETMMPPLRLQMRLNLRLDKAGAYAFGASSSQWASLKVDGKTVFQRDPMDPGQRQPVPADLAASAVIAGDMPERRGMLGAPVTLEAGVHSLEIEQVALSQGPNFSQLLRPLWLAPGMKEAQTLPLEILQDAP